MTQRLTACLNGDRDRSEHPAVPITPAESARAALACVDAGATAVHLHPRDRDGAESLLTADIGLAVAAVRRSCPGVPIGVSTGLWISGGDAERRQFWVSQWAELAAAERPDVASVNLSEPGSARLISALADAGVAVEAGIASVSDVQALAGLGPEIGWQQILVEIGEPPPGPTAAAPIDAVHEADQVLAALAGNGNSVPVLLHGEQSASWPCVRHAGRLGLPSRIGLEDVTTGPNGIPVRDNAHLVRLAMSEWRVAALRTSSP